MVKFVNPRPFQQFKSKFFFWSLLSLYVEFLSEWWPLFSLPVDESRGTFKNIFLHHTAIVTYFSIIVYLVTYVPHFKGLTSRISKIYIAWKSNDPTGSCHIFSISVVKMTNFDLRAGNWHVIHQIEANDPGIISKLILTENFYPGREYIENFKFWKFSPMTS